MLDSALQLLHTLPRFTPPGSCPRRLPLADRAHRPPHTTPAGCSFVGLDICGLHYHTRTAPVPLVPAFIYTRTFPYHYAITFCLFHMLPLCIFSNTVWLVGRLCLPGSRQALVRVLQHLFRVLLFCCRFVATYHTRTPLCLRCRGHYTHTTSPPPPPTTYTAHAHAAHLPHATPHTPAAHTAHTFVHERTNANVFTFPPVFYRICTTPLCATTLYLLDTFVLVRCAHTCLRAFTAI